LREAWSKLPKKTRRERERDETAAASATRERGEEDDKGNW
jgi:hypothetical protein